MGHGAVDGRLFGRGGVGRGAATADGGGSQSTLQAQKAATGRAAGHAQAAGWYRWQVNSVGLQLQR